MSNFKQKVIKFQKRIERREGVIKVTLSRNWKEDMYLLEQLPEPTEGNQVLVGTK